MKYIAITSILLIGCNTSSYKHISPDTLEIPVMYRTQEGRVNIEIIYGVAHDTLIVDTFNKSRPKLKWKRDTTYYVPQIKPVYDSSGFPEIDSATKKPKGTIEFVKTYNEVKKITIYEIE